MYLTGPAIGPEGRGHVHEILQQPLVIGRPLGQYQGGVAIIPTVSAAAMAYHGYRRTRSYGWAFAWALFGGMIPIVAVPVSLAQGFGKRK